MIGVPFDRARRAYRHEVGSDPESAAKFVLWLIGKAEPATPEGAQLWTGATDFSNDARFFVWAFDATDVIWFDSNKSTARDKDGNELTLEYVTGDWMGNEWIELRQPVRHAEPATPTDAEVAWESQLERLTRLQSSALCEVFDFFRKHGIDVGDEDHSAALSTGLDFVTQALAAQAAEIERRGNLIRELRAKEREGHAHDYQMHADYYAATEAMLAYDAATSSHWTIDLPNREGWWWWKQFETDTPCVREIFQSASDGVMRSLDGNGCVRSLDWFGGLWSDAPISEPTTRNLQGATKL